DPARRRRPHRLPRRPRRPRGHPRHRAGRRPGQPRTETAPAALGRDRPPAARRAAAGVDPRAGRGPARGPPRTRLQPGPRRHRRAPRGGPRRARRPGLRLRPGHRRRPARRADRPPAARLGPPPARRPAGARHPARHPRREGGPGPRPRRGPGRRDLPAAAHGAATLVRRWKAAAVAVTLGARGALLSYGDHPLLVPAGAVHHGDTCGAGDRFAATAAGLLADGALVGEAVERAVAAATGFVGAGGAGALPRAAAAHTHLPDGDDPFALADGVRAAHGTVVAPGGCLVLLHA